MATISMKELINQFGDGETVSKPSTQKIGRGGKRAMGEKSYQEHRSRQDTETLIKTYLEDKPEGASIIAIARHLGRTASPHFRSIVLQMRDRHELIESVDMAPNQRLVRYLYSLATVK
jgi:hypothetical protein